MNIDTEKLSKSNKLDKVCQIVEFLDDLAIIVGESSVKLACDFYLDSFKYKCD